VLTYEEPPGERSNSRGSQQVQSAPAGYPGRKSAAKRRGDTAFAPDRSE